MSRQKNTSDKKKSIPDPGKIYKRNPKQKNLGGRSRIFRKSYKRIPNKISKFPSFQNFKNTCHFLFFIFARIIPRKTAFDKEILYLPGGSPEKTAFDKEIDFVFFKSSGRPEKHMTPILAINFGHLPRIVSFCLDKKTLSYVVFWGVATFFLRRKVKQNS